MRLRSLGQEDPLEEGIAIHSSILAWRIPWTEESCGLQSMGSQRSQTRLRWLSMHTPVYSFPWIQYSIQLHYGTLKIHSMPWGNQGSTTSDGVLLAKWPVGDWTPKSQGETVGFLKPILAAESLSGRPGYGKYIGYSSLNQPPRGSEGSTISQKELNSNIFVTNLSQFHRVIWNGWLFRLVPGWSRGLVGLYLYINKSDWAASWDGGHNFASSNGLQPRVMSRRDSAGSYQ